MRPHEKQQQDFKPQNLFCDVALLVCQARLPDPVKGRTEGPHCPVGGLSASDSTEKHLCDSTNSLCQQAVRVRKESLELWWNQLPLCIQVIALPTECSTEESHCPSGSLVLEKWTCHAQPRRNPDEKLLPGQFLLQAIRSHLHFSLLSAWLTKAKGKLPFKIEYIVSLPGEEDKNKVNDSYQVHHFPTYQIGKALVLSVSVQSLPRSEEAPLLPCVCTATSQEASQIIGDVKDDDPVTTDKDEGQNISVGNRSEPSGHISSLRWTPIRLPPVDGIVGSGSIAAENPLFDPADSDLWSSDINKEMAALSLRRGQVAESAKKSPKRRRFRDNECDNEGVKFYISTEDAGRNEAEAAPLSQNNHLFQKAKDRGFSRQKKRLSQKILFSGENELILSEDDGADFLGSASTTSGLPVLPVDEEPVLDATSTSGNISRKTSLDEEERKGRQMELKSPRSVPPHSHGSSTLFPGGSKLPRRSCLPRRLTEGQFHRKTGLPLSSSPAPMKRNQHSFVYDTSLNSVAGIRSALCYDQDSGSSDSETGTSLCKSAPASTNLLGNFEESALNGRIKPFGSIEGFVLELAASGAFCPPHATLTVTTFFFNVSDDNAPSPYLGHCSLESVGRKGYHLPRKGTVQATLFNPQGTVVKMFVVRYDMSEMPPSCQTFVRQRTFFMPSSASLQDARQNRSWLRYLIHLRFATSRSGKLYMHTDIRMLFSRKSELDAKNLETESGGTIASCDAGNYELRSFTEMPKNPKFSPKKLGSFNSRSEKDKNLS